MKTIDDIYPRTIVKMRFGGKYAIFEADAESWIGVIPNVQESEEVYYECDIYLEENCYCRYGIGDTPELRYT